MSEFQENNNIKIVPVNNPSSSDPANAIIRSYAVAAAFGGLMPIPLIDIASVTAIQKQLIQRLADINNVVIEETDLKVLVAPLIGSVAPRLVSEAIKFIPGVGTVAGGITMSAMSFATTYAVGKVFQKHFSSGGNILDFEPENFRQYYQEQYKKGKNQAKEYVKAFQSLVKAKVFEPKKTPESNSNTNNQPNPTDIVILRLKEFAKLKEQGLLTEDEFTEIKNKLFSNL